MTRVLFIFVIVCTTASGLAQDRENEHFHVIGLDVNTTVGFNFKDFQTLNVIGANEYILDRNNVQCFVGFGYSFNQWFKNKYIPSISTYTGISRLLRFRPYRIIQKSSFITPIEVSSNIYLADVGVSMSWMPRREPLFSIFGVAHTWNIHVAGKLDKFLGSPTGLNESAIIPSIQVGPSLVMMYRSRTTGNYIYYPVTFNYTWSQLNFNTFGITFVFPIFLK